MAAALKTMFRLDRSHAKQLREIAEIYAQERGTGTDTALTLAKMIEAEHANMLHFKRVSLLTSYAKESLHELG